MRYKKLFLLIFLIFSTSIFSNENLEFKVKLNLLSPLLLKVDKTMDFGVLKKGMSVEKEALIVATGNEGQGYKITINEGKEAQLVSENNSDSIIPVKLSFKEARGIFTDKPEEFKLKGLAEYANNAKLSSGKYTGDITVRICYN
ncbi:MAG: hypothetical protein RR476_01585 [Cetobacterium sp.]|uniref:hypothetical protein n=1 Tax=Cetobacterium sp. TaxID=2071632 RepID=UPI002FC606E1